MGVFYPCKGFLHFSLGFSFTGTNYNPATIYIQTDKTE
jgi:hypothetical protein